MKVFITNKNFNKIKSEEFYTTDGTLLKISKGKKIEIEFDMISTFAIYYYKNEDLFVFGNNFEKVVEYLTENNVNLTEAELDKYIQTCGKKKVKETYKYNEIKAIEGWKKITIDKNGNFEKTEAELPFTIELEDSLPLIKEWYFKYLNLVNKAIDEKKFLPSVTGGLDTRIMTVFWRNRINELDNYYLKAVKQDGKDMVEKGELEIQISDLVCKRLGKELTRVEDFGDKITCSGLFTEHGRKEKNLNNPEFFTRFVQHHYSKSGLNFEHILPFIDNNYLRIKHPKLDILRVLFARLFCDDLTDILLVGFGGSKPYFLKERFAWTNEKVDRILESWGSEANFLQS